MLNLSDAYHNNPNTSTILLNLQSTQNKWTVDGLATIYNVYRTSLMERIIQIIKKKLVIFKPTMVNAKNLSLIIVSNQL